LTAFVTKRLQVFLFFFLERNYDIN